MGYGAHVEVDIEVDALRRQVLDGFEVEDSGVVDQQCRCYAMRCQRLHDIGHSTGGGKVDREGYGLNAVGCGEFRCYCI